MSSSAGTGAGCERKSPANGSAGLALAGLRSSSSVTRKWTNADARPTASSAYALGSGTSSWPWPCPLSLLRIHGSACRGSVRRSRAGAAGARPGSRRCGCPGRASSRCRSCAGASPSSRSRTPCPRYGSPRGGRRRRRRCAHRAVLSVLQRCRQPPATRRRGARRRRA